MMKVIDGFAGIGGFSEGARLAGMQPVFAFNHWELACQLHQVNHPRTRVECQDAHIINWAGLPAHDLGLFSPACQGHSPARGKEQPRHDAMRSTAWAVVDYAEFHGKPIVVENVPEFLQWGRFPAWSQAMQSLGYSIAPHVIDAADHGVPQHRERVFLVLTKSKAPLELVLPKREHVAVDKFIEWGQHSWTAVDKPGRSKATLERIASGRAKFGRRFVAPFYGSGSGTTGRSLDRPLGTITTIDRWALIDGDRMRVLQPSENRSIMGFGDHIVLPKVKRSATHMLGNAVCPPVARDLLQAMAARL
jgi:DNA (cytosine-5)-methyltransferase 1